MPVIKRYANRKLYDTESKRYVTLDDLAEAIRRGEEVRVVDHVTGDDLTSVTLLQLVFEEEKKIGGLLPQVALTRLIRSGGGMVNAVRSRVAALDPFQLVDDEIRRRISALVENGQLAEEEAQRIQDLLLRKSPQPAPEPIHIPVQGEEEPVTPLAPDQEPADPAEVEMLLRQVDMLEQELRRLQQSA